MTGFLERLAARRRFGMKPGLGTITRLAAALGDPQKKFKSIHVAGTNGKGAVCAILDAALRTDGRLRVGRYTSPHLVKLNERYFLDGAPVADGLLESAAAKVERAVADLGDGEVTFFEALTAAAFVLYAEAKADVVVMETGLGGRLDATNVCDDCLSVITRIGLDHCDWLGDTVEKIAAEKAGIIKPGVPVVLGRNEPSVRAVVEARARAVGAPFHYAPELADESEIPADFPLRGAFNRENAVTALAALKVVGSGCADRSGSGPYHAASCHTTILPTANCQLPTTNSLVWPGRFQEVGRFIVDGAHNPPAAAALREALGDERFTLVCGFCGDKDVAEVLRILKPNVTEAIAVKTNNPRSLSAGECAEKLAAAGIPAIAAPSLAAALETASGREGRTLVCGSLFLAGEAVVALGAYPWGDVRFDPAEKLR